MKYKGYILKRKVEDLLMLPAVMVGGAKDSSVRSKEYDIFFFFPFYHTGGAEQVHLQVARIFGRTHKCIIFFTRTSVDNRYLEEFRNTGCEIADISRYTDNKLLYYQNLTWRGRISNMINSQVKKPVVFNGQCNFGYKISPWIRKDIRQIELIHSFNSFSWIRLPFLPFISKTIMISKRRIEEHLQQYKKLEVPGELAEKIVFIPNAIELPEQPCKKQFSTIKLLFVGRGTPEKRPELFIEIANAASDSGLTVQWTIVGDMDEKITAALPANVVATGSITNPALLHEIYCAHHILVIPSSTEGFPIVLMEAMARGCAVMATPVGDIPFHINNDNGFLFSSTDPAIIINESVAWLKDLTPGKMEHLSNSATSYAFKNFGIEMFNQQYKAILQP
jgi:glycosyltransferase involved in cell wall biosynthesis